MLDRTQQILLGMLKEIDGLCRSNEIHYSIGGGTAIGAIRHGGFIPWDDDVDLYMTRDNWEKFIEIFEEGKFPSNRVLESCEIDPEYSNTFGRYVATDNAAVHSHQIATEDPAGYVIDIFVFDPIMRNDMNKFLEDYMLECDLINLTMGFSTRFDMNIRKYKKYLARKNREGLVPIVRELTTNIKKMGSDGHDSYVMEWGSAPMLMPAGIFDQGYIRMPFENIEVESVKSFSEYLTYQFGDEWVYMPRHDGIEGHEAIFSETITYSEIRADFRVGINMDRLRKAYVARKLKLLKSNPIRHKLEDYEATCEAIRTKLQLEKIISDNKIDVIKLHKDRNYAELNRVFGAFFDSQFAPKMIGRLDRHSKQYRFFTPICIMIGDELMRIAIETLIRTERMSKAARLIEVYEYCGGSRDNIEELDGEIKEARALINRMSVARKDSMKMLIDDVDRFIEKFPYNSQIKRMRIRLMLNSLGGISSEYAKDELLNAVEALKAEFPIGTLPHGELYKYEADVALLIEGDVDKARQLYEYAYVHSTNGIIRGEIESVADEIGIKLDESVEPWDELERADYYRTDIDDAQVMKHTDEYGFNGIKIKFLKIRKRVHNLIVRNDNNIKQNAINSFLRTKDRVELKNLFEGKIDDLKQVYENEDFETLNQKLKSHRQAIERNYSLGLGLMVHPDLSRLQYEVYKREGKSELADRIDALVPYEHRTPIGEK